MAGLRICVAAALVCASFGLDAVTLVQRSTQSAHSDAYSDSIELIEFEESPDPSNHAGFYAALDKAETGEDAGLEKGEGGAETDEGEADEASNTPRPGYPKHTPGYPRHTPGYPKRHSKPVTPSVPQEVAAPVTPAPSVPQEVAAPVTPAPSVPQEVAPATPATPAPVAPAAKAASAPKFKRGMAGAHQLAHHLGFNLTKTVERAMSRPQRVCIFPFTMFCK